MPTALKIRVLREDERPVVDAVLCELVSITFRDAPEDAELVRRVVVLKQDTTRAVSRGRRA